MSKLNKLVRKNLGHFLYFYAHLGYRLIPTFALNLIIGILDGFGLAMFLPMLAFVDGESETSAEGLGDLDFLIKGLENIGIELTLNSILIVMLVFFFLKGVVKFFSWYYKVIVQQFFMKTLRLKNISLLTEYQYEKFVASDAGKIQNTLTTETERVVIGFTAYFNCVQAAMMLLVYVVMAYLANPQFALLLSLGGFLSNYSFKYIYRKTTETSRKITVDGHIYQGLLLQKINLFKYLKATGLGRPFGERLRASIERIEKSNRLIGFYNAIMIAVREPMVMLVVVGVIIVQITYFGQTLGLIILSLLFFYRALTHLLSLQTEWNKFLNVSGSLENMTEFQETLMKHKQPNGEIEIEKLTDGIKLESVNFNYGETPILRDVTFDVKKNETVAFIGESGSGKTTLVNLMVGLMRIRQGTLSIDGIDINKLDLKSYQSRIGYITQEPVVFNDTIFNNVTFWAPRNTETELKFWECLKKASIKEFVRSLKDQENELLGNNGINLSGGQRQRISIARELYKEIDVLVMDEATSALDSETEKEIQENMESLKGEYTMLIVAHRLSTVKSADKLILLKKGRIEEMGNYDELIVNSENFKRMVKLQEV